ncbi:polysaccharide deacetylase family protein [uncultured Aquimarina sp.]|uniref:polysaccharide deacetylase family protein n=1 Tax=uncultured Aquimarina sp. TaxID=575652 RepID=UPI00262BD8AB|nr:polysaccharide deacetylase family protein [uncultured Aquimarina sp.]
MLWIKIKYRLTILYKALFFKLGLGKLLLKNRYGEHILVFHGIDQKEETKYNSRFISEKYFENLIRYFTENYNVISLDDFYQKKFKKETLNIALTFDDGYLNNYKYAIPILKKYNIPACFYITPIHEKSDNLWPDFLDLVSFYSQKNKIFFEGENYMKNSRNEYTSNNVSLKNKCKTLPYDKIFPLYQIFEKEWNEIQLKPLVDYWSLMTSDQIKEIAYDPLFTIGSHGLTHSNLQQIDLNEAKLEIAKSKTVLENVCKQSIDEFAFPFGTYTNELVNYCKEIGFSKILLVDYNTQDDSKDITTRNRFVMNPYISMKQQISCLLKGSYF